MLFLIIPVLGATTLSGVKLMGNYSSGETITFPMTLSTSPSDPPITYQITAMDFGNTNNGGYIEEPYKTSNVYSATPYIKLDKNEITINPGTSETVTATIKIPSSHGGLYSLINIHPKVKITNGTSVVTSMNVPVMITIKNTTLTKTGIITNITIDSSNTISTVFTNTGNTHCYNVKNVIGVNVSGKEKYLSTPPMITAIVPGGTVIFSQQLNETLSSNQITSYIIEGEQVIAIEKTIITLQKPPVQQIPTTIPTTVQKSPLGIMIIILSIISIIYLKTTTSFK